AGRLEREGAVGRGGCGACASAGGHRSLRRVWERVLIGQEPPNGWWIRRTPPPRYGMALAGNGLAGIRTRREPHPALSSGLSMGWPAWRGSGVGGGAPDLAVRDVVADLAPGASHRGRRRGAAITHY